MAKKILLIVSKFSENYEIGKEDGQLKSAEFFGKIGKFAGNVSGTISGGVEGYFKSYKDGKKEGYNKGEYYGKAIGSTVGNVIGFTEGVLINAKEEYKLAEEIGYNAGKLVALSPPVAKLFSCVGAVKGFVEGFSETAEK